MILNIPLKDSILISYEDNTALEYGCPTCDMGWVYISHIEITTTNFIIQAKLEYYNQPIGADEIMAFFGAIDFKNCTEREFCEKLGDFLDSKNLSIERKEKI